MRHLQKQQQHTEPETNLQSSFLAPSLAITNNTPTPQPPPTTKLWDNFYNNDDDLFACTPPYNHPLSIETTTYTKIPNLQKSQTPQSPTDMHQLVKTINSPDTHKLPTSYLHQTFNLTPITFSETDYTDNIACRKCRSNINFDKLLKIPDHIPRGGQIFWWCSMPVVDGVKKKRLSS